MQLVINMDVAVGHHALCLAYVPRNKRNCCAINSDNLPLFDIHIGHFAKISSSKMS